MNKEIKKGLVPVLRFPEFSEKLKNCVISDFAHVTTGNKDTQNKVDNGDYPFFVRSQTVERINSFSYDGEAILTSGDGVGVGKNFHYIVGKFDFHQRVYCIYNFDKTVSGKFIYQYFSENFYKREIQLSAKNSVDSVRMSMITEMPISLPELPEQTKIAACLSSLDDLITAQTQKIEALKTHKKGLMQQLFPQEGETVPKLRFPEFLDSGEWVQKTIDKWLTIGNGKDYKHLSKGNVPVYGTGGYMLSVDDYLYDGESVCIGRKGTINNPMFLNGKFWTVDTLFYTHSFKGCLPKFIYLIFQNINWLNHNEAGGVPSLSKTNIGKIEIAVPSEEEQQKIADCLSSLDDLINAHVKKCELLKIHKKGLMQGLFPSSNE